MARPKPQEPLRAPEYAREWCEEVATRYRERAGVRVPSDLASEAFHAIAALAAIGYDYDLLAKMFGSTYWTISTLLDAYHALTAEVLALTRPTVPLNNRLNVSDARMVARYEPGQQLKAALNLIATSQRVKKRSKVQRGK